MSYAELVVWTCDECGTETQTDRVLLPLAWEELDCEDLCEDCANIWHTERQCMNCGCEDSDPVNSDGLCEECAEEENE